MARRNVPSHCSPKQARSRILSRKEPEPKCRADRGHLGAGAACSWGRLAFQKAMHRYLAERQVNVWYPESYTFISKSLCASFWGRRLDQVTTDDVQAYRAARINAGRHLRIVNREVGLLVRLLKQAKLWHPVGDEVAPVGIVEKPRLTSSEKRQFFQIAAAKPECQTACCAVLLTANATLLRPVELKYLKWADLDPENRELLVWQSKTEAGTRSVPLNHEAWAAVVALKQRAEVLGGYAPEHYIFPRLCGMEDL